MELHQLRYVQAVAECGSFTAAAAQLYLAQPSLSTQVRKLERELRVELFDRGGSETRLTNAGERFLEHATLALAELERARAAALDAVRERSTTPVSLGVLPSIGASLLPDAVVAAREADVTLTTLERNTSDEFVELVAAGRLDLAVVSVTAMRSGLTGRPLAREPLAAQLPPEHHSRGDSELSLRDLDGEPFVAMPAGSALREVLDAACARVGVVPHIVAEARHLASVWAMVRAGLGVAVLPVLALDAALPAVRLADEYLHRDLVVAWRRGARLTSAQDTVVTALVAAAARRSQTYYPVPVASPA